MFTFMQPVSEDITRDKYFLHGEKSVEEMFEGVATVASSLEKNKDLWKEIFYSEMIEGRLTPAGRILANARPNSPMRNYHNCFVIPIFDSMEDIYTALLEDSLIGKAGGGCVAKDSKVYVKDKGLIDIQEVEEGDLVYSFNIKTQTKEFKRVLQTHTPVVEKERQIGIVLSNNTKLITSKNHPTLVYKDGGFKYIPASEVKKYDLMLKFTFADIEANSSEDMSDIAWFVGAHLGDGSTDRVESHEFTKDYLGFGMNRKTCRLRISKSSFEVVQKYSEVLNKYSELNTSVVVENNPRWKVPMWGVHTTGTSVYSFIDKYIGQFSKKTYTMYIPKWIFTSSRETILGFIAGLIDTDGYVGGRRIEYSTASKQMQEDLLLLLSLLDVDYVLERARTSKGFLGCEPNNDTLHYCVSIEDRQFMVKLLPYLVNKQRIEGINTILASSQKVKMVVLDELLVLFEKYRAKKMLTKSVTPVTLHDISKVDEVVNKVMSRATKEDQKTIKYYYEIGKSLRVVKNIIEFPDVDTQFYDLTVEENNNYFAGIQGLSVIHNTGLNFSNLRPKGAKISKGGESSGVMSFMEVFNASAKSIHTGGNRRSAHLGALNIDHPDIEEFITYKRGDENGRLTQFNISVGITDKFIEAVKADADWDLVFDGKIYKTVKAKYLYNLITDNMFLYNEPGILYLDEVARNNNGWYKYDIDATNPCGEQPLPPYSSCCLSAINLSSLVKKPFTDEAEFDFDTFETSVAIGVRFLDDILDVSEYPIDKIKEMVLSERRIGLGYTGMGDMLAKMKMAYGSPESMELNEKIAILFRDSSYLASIQLAKEKGPFPTYDEKILESGFIQRLPEHIKEGIRKYGLRNVALNTIAPNGTISLSIGNNCSSGIEPIFALEYTRNVRQPDDTFIPQKVYNKAWLEYIQFLGETPKEIPYFFKTADEISLDESVHMQALWQKYIDASISKTITLPDDCTIDEYRNLFMKTYEAKLKGYTTYNPKGYLKPILTKEEKKDETIIEETRYAKKRPEVLPCDIYEMMVNKKRMVVLVGLMNDKPYEVFLTEDPDNTINVLKAKQGTIQKVKISKELSRYDLHITGKKGDLVLQNITQVFDDDYAIMCRLASLYLRHENPLQFLVEQLNRTRGFDTFSKTLYRVLKKYLDGEVVLSSQGVCPECGTKLQYMEGCVTCPSCGFSKC